MRIAVAADHAGVVLIDVVIAEVLKLGYEPLDLGTHDANKPDDYPDYALLVGNSLREGRGDRAVLICGSGVGASIAANKIHGIRSCMCMDTYSARQGVEHDDMNVLCLGARVIGVELAVELVQAFLPARFTGEERHKRRLDKVLALERRNWE